MRQLVIISFTLVSFFLHAQESQSVAMAKWKDGQYTYFNMDFWGGFKWNSHDDKSVLKITKTKGNAIHKISIKGKFISGEFSNPDSSVSKFVRHYTSTSYSDEKLFVKENCIVIYRLKEVRPKPKIEILYCIGEKQEEKIITEISDYLEQTIMHYVPSVLGYSKDIDSIKAVIINNDNDELVSDQNIEIGLIVKTKWGVVLKSKNMGGNLDTRFLGLTSPQLTRSTEGSKVLWKIDCKKAVNSEFEIVIFLTKEPDVKYTTKLPVKCDTENSPVNILNRAFLEYDAIKYAVLIDGKENIRTLKKVAETGYLSHAAYLLEISKKKRVNTDLIQVKKDNKVGYMDKTGKLIIPLEYDDGNVDDFSEGLIGVMKDKKCGFINLKNKIIVPFNYDMVWNHKDSIASVRLNGKLGMVNAAGKEVLPPVYDAMYGFHQGLAIVKKDNKYGFVNKAGKVVVNIIYEDAFDFNSWNSATVKLNGKFGSINTGGKVVVPIEFEKYPRAINNDLFVVYKNEKYGIITKTGKLLFDYKYDEIFNCGSLSAASEKIIRVKENGFYGFVKTDGTVLVESKYDSAEDFFFGLAKIRTWRDGATYKGNLLTDGREAWDNIEQDPDVSSSSSSSGSGKSSSKQVSDKKTIKNVGKKPLYVRAGRGPASHINPGSSSSFSCRQDIYYCNDDGKGNHTITGQLISGANQDCGTTVSAYGGN